MKQNRRNRLYIAALALLFLPTRFLLGEPSIQRFFPGFEDSRFILKNEETSLAKVADLGPFPLAFLEESRLSSLSLWEMKSPNAINYNLKVWELLDDLGAYQLYTHWPELADRSGAERLDAPVGNWFSPQESLFWRGNFLISLSKKDGKPLQPGEFVSLVEAFTSAIDLPNLLPVTISHLPSEEMSVKTPLFYLGEKSLKSNKEFPEPLLQDIGFADRIEITYAGYGPERRPLFLIGYPTHELAREYSARIRADLDGYFSDQPVFMKRSGLLVAVFTGPEEQAVNLLNQVSYTPTIQYFQKAEEEPRPSATVTFLGLITKAILGTGTFIIFIIIVGFFAGVLRYQIMQKFPKFAKRNDSVRLNLD